MTNPDLENIRAVAPEWAEWLCFTTGGVAYWQSERGDGDYWNDADDIDEFDQGRFSAHGIAIDLKTGAIHVQHAGKIVVVSLAEWSAEE